MPDFRPIVPSDAGLLSHYFNDSRSRCCDLTVGGTMMWRSYFGSECCVYGDSLIIRVDFYGDKAYVVPIGGDRMRALRAVAEDDPNPLFCVVSREDLGLLAGCFGGIGVTAHRESFDYLYLASDMRDLPGKRFSGQRNHINKFLSVCGDWSFRVIDPSDIADAERFIDAFHQNMSGLGAEEEQRSRCLVRHMAEYGCVGGMLTVGGAVCGVTVCEKIGDTCYIHVEKADRTVPGVYPMLFREASRAFADCKYINREEDDGNEGLRTSKLSYHPVRLIRKYLVRPL